jgi:hypothetical protein
VFGYVLDPTIVQAFSGCGDCIFYKLQTLKTAQDFGAKPFKFRPLDKDDAVPTVRIEREMGPLPSISAFGSVFPHGGAVFLRNIIHRTL